MNSSDYRTSLSIDRSPAEVYAAVTDPRAWWLDTISGEADVEGAELEFHVPGVHWTRLRVAEATPYQRVVWEVLDARIEFVADRGEWIGSRIEFAIEPTATGADLAFVHRGLAEQLECFDSCSNAWATLVHGSLRALLTSGVGAPYRAAA